jgi:general secretion pathway protein H
MKPARADGLPAPASPPLRGARPGAVARAGAGMTLIELLVVLMLMGLIAAMAVPYFSGGVSGTDLKSAAREVAAGLRYARSDAVANRRETRLVLDLEQRAFRIDGDARLHALPKLAELKLYTAQRDLIDAKSGAIRFFPDGGSNGGRITIAAGERKYEVDVDWLTGRVAIAD